MTSQSKKPPKTHPLLWVVESLEEEPSYLEKKGIISKEKLLEEIKKLKRE